jgi:hypothetical protein
MKKTFLISLSVLFMFAANLAFAQGPGMMGGYGGGYGMGPGMMGGQGGGNYCPNCGAYQGPQGGYGMGPGMMGPGMMGPGMMGPGWRGRGWANQSEECQKFLNDTAAMRKDLFGKRYEYFEALRNPKTTADQAAKMEKEIWDLQQKIYSKAPQACW